MATPASTTHRPPSRNRKIVIGVAVGIVALFLCLLISLLVRGSGSPSRKQPSTPPAAKPALTSPLPAPVVTPRPSPMPEAPKLAPRSARTYLASAAIGAASSQELVRELKQISSQLGEIREAIEREREVASTTTAQLQFRHEQLSDRELERRFKERLLNREP